MSLKYHLGFLKYKANKSLKAFGAKALGAGAGAIMFIGSASAENSTATDLLGTISEYVPYIFLIMFVVVVIWGVSKLFGKK
jgi:hypothetical protein